MFCILHISLAFVCIYYRENYEIIALQILRCEEIDFFFVSWIIRHLQKYLSRSMYELSVLWVDFEETSAVRLEHHITTTRHVNQSDSAWHKVRQAREPEWLCVTQSETGTWTRVTLRDTKWDRQENQSDSAWHKVRQARERLEAKHLSVLHPVAFMEAINLAVNSGGRRYHCSVQVPSTWWGKSRQPRVDLGTCGCLVGRIAQSRNTSPSSRPCVRTFHYEVNNAALMIVAKRPQPEGKQRVLAQWQHATRVSPCALAHYLQMQRLSGSHLRGSGFKSRFRHVPQPLQTNV
jgi:hypothetical protein